MIEPILIGHTQHISAEAEKQIHGQATVRGEKRHAQPMAQVKEHHGNCGNATKPIESGEM
jgi:hypothetical protein